MAMYISFVCFISLFSALKATSCDYNYQFVLDESGSVKQANYIESVDFLIDLVRDHIAAAAPVGALAYSSAKYDIDYIYQFGQPQTPKEAGILHQLELEKADYRGGWTYTKRAMQAAIDEFKTAGYTTNNVLLLITDGQATVKTPTDNPCYDNSIKQQLDDNDIRVIIVGVANFDAANSDTVSCLADPADTKKIIGFDFQSIINILQQDQIVCTCNEEGVGEPCTPSGNECDQYGECMTCCSTGRCHKKPSFSMQTVV